MRPPFRFPPPFPAPLSPSLSLSFPPRFFRPRITHWKTFRAATQLICPVVASFRFISAGKEKERIVHHALSRLSHGRHVLARHSASASLRAPGTGPCPPLSPLLYLTFLFFPFLSFFFYPSLFVIHPIRYSRIEPNYPRGVGLFIIQRFDVSRSKIEVFFLLFFLPLCYPCY